MVQCSGYLFLSIENTPCNDIKVSQLGYTLSMKAVGRGEGLKKGFESAVIIYCLNAVERGSKKAQILRSSLTLKCPSSSANTNSLLG